MRSIRGTMANRTKHGYAGVCGRRTTLLILLTAIGMVSSPLAFAAQNVVVVVDDSGSMDEPMRKLGVRRIDAAKEALRIVLAKLSSDAQIGIVALNNGWILPLQQIDRSQVDAQIARIEAMGGTPLGAVLKAGMDELLKKRADQIYGDYRLLVVTDGEANDQDFLLSILPDVMARGVTVDVIGVDMQSDHSLATEVHSYRRADDPDSLQVAISEALAEAEETDMVGSESDFEILEDFPVEFATVALAAMTTANNQPIQPTEQFTSRGVSFHPSTGSRGGGGVLGILGAACCMGFTIFLVLGLTVLVRVIRKH